MQHNNKRKREEEREEDREKGKEKIPMSEDEEEESEDTLGESAPEEEVPPKKRSGFRLQSKQLFLTYPKCDLPPEDVLTQLKPKLGEISDYIVAQEEHQVRGTLKLPISKKCQILIKKMHFVNGGSKSNSLLTSFFNKRMEVTIFTRT